MDYLKSRVSPKDCAGLLEKLGTNGQRFFSEEAIFLNGFGGAHEQKAAIGRIRRVWAWARKDDALKMGIGGLTPPETAQPLRLHWRDEHIASLLVGIESSAPLKTDLFGVCHTTSAKSHVLSAFGKRKWRDFRKGRLRVPADLGGTQATMIREEFEEAVAKCIELGLSRPSATLTYGDSTSEQAERMLFRTLLRSTPAEGRELLQEHGSWRPLRA